MSREGLNRERPTNLRAVSFAPVDVAAKAATHKRIPEGVLGFSRLPCLF